MYELNEGAVPLDRALTTMLQQYWDSPLARPRPGEYWLSTAPLLGTSQDQVSSTDNPYWEALRWWPLSLLRRGYFATQPGIRELPELEEMRTLLYQAYAYAVPSPADIDWMERILNGRAVADVFAGGGYWAWQLAQKGVNVLATDAAPPRQTYQPVLRMCAGTVITDRALFICWPPGNSSAAYEALRVYEGDLLIYCGEINDGCHGDDAFFAELHYNWRLMSMSPAHVTWDCLSDVLVAFERKQPRRPGNLWGMRR
ncbi:hypothetical protein [Microbispora sp. NPDC049125]|uniref:hypothetical protein n=1 Tax=Microbispora sp. NPDC049125 TaxID=3154929 RepID=UPI003467A6EA